MWFVRDKFSPVYHPLNQNNKEKLDIKNEIGN